MGDLIIKRLCVAAGVYCSLICGNSVAFGQSSLYTEGPGVNPPFEDIRDSITNGYPGTIIDVNNEAVEGGLYGAFGIEDDLRLHTLANSSISESNFDQWSRWYQTDGATQIFRLFPGEENVRNSRPLAARVEAFDANTGWNVADGEWHEWVGRYTIVKPINAAIFQVKDVDDEAWSMQLNMESSGRVKVQHRTPLPGQSKFETLVNNAIGQPFDIRIRDNGLNYEVYFGNQTQPFTSGQYIRNDQPGDNSDTRFRWGIYVGAQEVQNEAMIFVSHATVDPVLEPLIPPDYSTLIAGWENWSEVGTDTWNATQVAGVTAQAVGTPEAGGVWFNFSNATVENGASSDGQYGALGPCGADPSVALPTDGVTLSNGFDGHIDFGLTDTTGTARALTGFHFDVGAFRPNAATDWQLEVLAGSDLTAGILASGTATVLAGPIQDDETVNLTGLADSTLDAFGSVIFRLTFTGGGGDSGSPASGHHLFLDNVGVTGLTLGVSGDFDSDGDVDGADFLEWQRTEGTPAGLTAWQNNYGALAPLAATSAAVPEPNGLILAVVCYLFAVNCPRESSY